MSKVSISRSCLSNRYFILSLRSFWRAASSSSIWKKHKQGAALSGRGLPAGAHKHTHPHTCTRVTNAHPGTKRKLDWGRLGESWDKRLVSSPLYSQSAHKSNNVWGPPGASQRYHSSRPSSLADPGQCPVSAGDGSGEAKRHSSTIRLCCFPIESQMPPGSLAI